MGMKIIKAVPVKARRYMFLAVNMAPEKGINRETRKTRESLFENLVKDADHVKDGYIFHDGKDLILKQSEKETLEACLKNAIWADMITSLDAKPAEELVAEAEDYTPPPAENPERG